MIFQQYNEQTINYILKFAESKKLNPCHNIDISYKVLFKPVGRNNYIQESYINYKHKDLKIIRILIILCYSSSKYPEKN